MPNAIFRADYTPSDTFELSADLFAKTLPLPAIAPQTFKLRTAQALQNRPATEALALDFSVHGPTVKMVETNLLKFRHEVFLDRPLSIARAHVRDKFLTYWSEIDQAFDEVDGDAEFALGPVCPACEKPNCEHLSFKIIDVLQ
ncbi:MAG: hypothetical protein COB39_06930 [Marinosulfonomonas sp.]|nr:MAG: hypothetical protein COB39_06930 [Marinosulfonomonas sp.]